MEVNRFLMMNQKQHGSVKIKIVYITISVGIMDYYKDKDFLEASLSLLARYYPISDSLAETLPEKNEDIKRGRTLSETNH